MVTLPHFLAHWKLCSWIQVLLWKQGAPCPPCPRQLRHSPTGFQRGRSALSISWFQAWALPCSSCLWITATREPAADSVQRDHSPAGWICCGHEVRARARGSLAGTDKLGVACTLEGLIYLTESPEGASPSLLPLARGRGTPLSSLLVAAGGREGTGWSCWEQGGLPPLRHRGCLMRAAVQGVSGRMLALLLRTRDQHEPHTSTGEQMCRQLGAWTGNTCGEGRGPKIAWDRDGCPGCRCYPEAGHSPAQTRLLQGPRHPTAGFCLQPQSPLSDRGFVQGAPAFP